ncbi:MAG: hypothetical protein OET55_10580 [Desulfuromonadales bacterium]|nr:hypothetical protein [Desulfuromonadales bacterium]
MLLVIFSAPICLLSFYLAFLCYRKSLYPHTIALTMLAVFMLLLTLGILAAGFLAGKTINDEIAFYYSSVLSHLS